MKQSSIILCLALLFALSFIPGVSGESISLSPRTSEGTAGGETDFTIIIDRVPGGLSGYNITVTVEDPGVAEIVNASCPDWVSFSSIYPSLPAGYVNLAAADFTGTIRPGDTNVELGYLTIRGLSKGASAITVNVNKMNTQSGDTIVPSLSGATVTVTSGSVPSSGGSGGGGGGGSGTFYSSITIPSTTNPPATPASAVTAETLAATPATSTPTEEVTAPGDGEVTADLTPVTMSESSTGEEGFPWLLIGGALVAVVVVVLAAVGYNKSREQE
jgi:hypothetical protein